MLKNDLLTVEIDSFGAELQSITSNTTHYSYLWHGDKTYWGRRSPVLFPLVGSVWNGKYHMDGKSLLSASTVLPETESLRSLKIAPRTRRGSVWRPTTALSSYIRAVSALR